jgi:hypothetical protein
VASFISYVNGKREGPFTTFADAFANFLPRVTNLAAEGCSLQVVETACWIQGDFDHASLSLPFVHARALAYDLGILVGKGEFQQPAPKVDPDAIEAALQRNYRDVRAGRFGEAEQIISE